MGTQLPPQKLAEYTQFSADVYCAVKRLYGSRWHLAWRWASAQATLWGPSFPPQKGVQPPVFGQCLLWRNISIYQDAANWYGGRPQPTRHCVKWGPSCPSPKGAQPPIFGQCPLWPNGWMDEDATWYGSRSRPRPQAQAQATLDGDPAHPAKRAQQPPSFWPMSIVATVAHLSYCWALVYKSKERLRNVIVVLLEDCVTRSSAITEGPGDRRYVSWNLVKRCTTVLKTAC